jgi:hypothetical protein
MLEGSGAQGRKFVNRNESSHPQDPAMARKVEIAHDRFSSFAIVEVQAIRICVECCLSCDFEDFDFFDLEIARNHEKHVPVWLSLMDPISNYRVSRKSCR